MGLSADLGADAGLSTVLGTGEGVSTAVGTGKVISAALGTAVTASLGTGVCFGAVHGTDEGSSCPPLHPQGIVAPPAGWRHSGRQDAHALPSIL